MPLDLTDEELARLGIVDDSQQVSVENDPNYVDPNDHNYYDLNDPAGLDAGEPQSGGPGIIGDTLLNAGLGALAYGLDARGRQPISRDRYLEMEANRNYRAETLAKGRTDAASINAQSRQRPPQGGSSPYTTDYADPGDGSQMIQTMKGGTLGRAWVHTPEGDQAFAQQQAARKPYSQWTDEEKLADWAQRGHADAQRAYAEVLKQRIINQDKGIDKSGLMQATFSDADKQAIAKLNYSDQLVDQQYANGKLQPDQYAAAKAQIARERGTIRPRMTPRDQSPFAEGQRPGDVWKDPDSGSRYTRDQDGKVRLLERSQDRPTRPPSPEAFSKMLDDYIAANTVAAKDSKPGSAPTEEEAVDAIKRRINLYKNAFGKPDAGEQRAPGGGPLPQDQATGEDKLRAAYQQAKAKGDAPRMEAAKSVADKFGIDLENKPAPGGDVPGFPPEGQQPAPQPQVQPAPQPVSPPPPAKAAAVFDAAFKGLSKATVSKAKTLDEEARALSSKPKLNLAEADRLKTIKAELRRLSQLRTTKQPSVGPPGEANPGYFRSLFAPY